MSWDYLKNLKGSRNLNLTDLATTIDLFNVFVRLGLVIPGDQLDNLQAQLDIIKYRSFETINEHTEAKYESN